MTKAKIYEIEILNMEDLNDVSGGTIAELDELKKAIHVNGSTGNKIAVTALKMLEDAEKALFANNKDYSNVIGAYAMEKILDKCYGIKSSISVGWCGTGFREVNNSYNGLTHEQVIDRINRG